MKWDNRLDAFVLRDYYWNEMRHAVLKYDGTITPATRLHYKFSRADGPKKSGLYFIKQVTSTKNPLLKEL